MNKQNAYFHLACYQLKLAAIGLASSDESHESLAELIGTLYAHIAEVSNSLGLKPVSLTTKPSVDMFDDFLEQSFVEKSLPDAYIFIQAALLDAIKDELTTKEMSALIDLQVSSLAYLSSQLLKTNLEDLLPCPEQVIH